MKNIDIVTSQNVTIEYPLASIGDRFLALLIDIGILLAWLLVIIMIVQNTSYYYMGIIYYLLYLPVLLTYNLVCEMFFGGQSVGKFALGIKVVKLNGQNPGISECLMRWVFRLIDIGFSLGAFAALFASSNDKNQRLGDMIARTVVIKLNPPYRYTIADLMSIGKANTSAGHEITYPQVIKYTDQDMLLIKNALERANKYPNTKHKELIEELSKKICMQLSIEQPPTDKKLFLQKILQDYIIQTR